MPIKVGVKIPVADPTLKIEGIRSPVNSYLSLQIRPVAELSMTQNDESVPKNERLLSCAVLQILNMQQSKVYLLHDL